MFLKPGRSAQTFTRALRTHWLTCGLSSVHEVWAVIAQPSAKGEGQATPPRQTHLLSVSGAVEGSLQDSLPRTTECQAESSLGITFIALRREGAEVSQGFQEGSRGADQSCPSTEAAGEALLLEG